jgi:hypothetical protein
MFSIEAPNLPLHPVSYLRITSYLLPPTSSPIIPSTWWLDDQLQPSILLYWDARHALSHASDITEKGVCMYKQTSYFCLLLE